MTPFNITQAITTLATVGDRCYQLADKRNEFKDEFWDKDIRALYHDNPTKLQAFDRRTERMLLTLQIIKINETLEQCLKTLDGNPDEVAHRIDSNQFLRMEELMANAITALFAISYKLNYRVAAAIIAKMDADEKPF
jgi:hypothetical protein